MKYKMEPIWKVCYKCIYWCEDETCIKMPGFGVGCYYCCRKFKDTAESFNKRIIKEDK